MWNLLWLVAGIIAFLLILNVAMTHRSRRRHDPSSLEREAGVVRYGGRTCPNCNQVFGKKVFFVNYPENSSFEIAGEIWNPEAAIVCPHCNYLNCWDPQGLPLFGRGEMFDPKMLEKKS